MGKTKYYDLDMHCYIFKAIAAFVMLLVLAWIMLLISTCLQQGIYKQESLSNLKQINCYLLFLLLILLTYFSVNIR